MAKLDALRPQLADTGDTLMQADGYALWLAWTGRINPTVAQTLEDYGGLSVAEAEGQALWFFFSAEMFLAAARLSVWARFNPLPLSLYAMPAKLQAGQGNAKNLLFDNSLWKLASPPPGEFRIWVHGSLQQKAVGIPGIGVSDDATAQEAPGPDWSLLSVDSRLPYQSRQTWYSLLRPVGNPVDRDFQSGWRDFFPHLETVLQRGKFRFTVHDYYLMFPLESLRALKGWCRDFLLLVERIKEEHPNHYWPCLLAVTERDGHNFNEDLPVKSGVPWQHLVPDYPHMHMQTAFLLGEDFTVHRVRFATPRRQPDDWASITMRAGGDSPAGSLPQLSPPALILGGEAACFYCGQTSHTPADCPSRLLAPLENGIWTEVAKLNLELIRNAVAGMGETLASLQEDGEKREYLSKTIRDSEAQGAMLRAFYDLGWPLQARYIAFFWRIRGKDVSKAAKDLSPMDRNPVWGALEDFLRSGGQENSAKEVKRLSITYPNDYRVFSLGGFLAMEAGDLEKAERLWKEAERCSPNPAVQAWHGLLLARTQECAGRFSQALKLYEQACRSLPNWQEPLYRKIVCLVKGGFSRAALNLLLPLIDRNGHVFNRAIIDPELERGYIQVQGVLWALWNDMEQKAKQEVDRLRSLKHELDSWFMPGNEFAAGLSSRIDNLLQLGEIRNFVAFQRLYLGRVALEKDLQAHVHKQARELKNTFRIFSERLREIHEESVWFPFPGVLVEFNKNYSRSVANVNWALRSNFHNPESFKRAQTMREEESACLKKLEKRMVFLRVIRDATLFILSMLETFFWLEVVCLLFIFVIFPLVMLYGDKLGLDIAGSLFAQERWQVQKLLFFVVSVIAASVAVLRTVLRFERIREKILAKAKIKTGYGKESAPDRTAAARNRGDGNTGKTPTPRRKS